MALGIATAVRNTKMNAIPAAIDAGAGPGFLRGYDGVRPATGGAVTTLLFELTFSDPSFAVAGSGSITANAINLDPLANNNGTATWFRVTDSVGTFIMDGDISTAGADCNLDSVSIILGKPVEITSMILTDGDA